MLEIVVQGEERYDEEKNEFIPALEPHKLKLEHSLLSVAKWEEINHKPFLSSKLDFTLIKDYIKCMTINPVPDKVYNYITPQIVEQVADYIKDSHTATWINDNKGGLPYKNGKMNGEIITAEIVYYWMISYQMPVEFQKWHLNRLLMLIRVMSIKNDPKGSKTQKMSNMDRHNLNKMRQAMYHTRG